MFAVVSLKHFVNGLFCLAISLKGLCSGYRKPNQTKPNSTELNWCEPNNEHLLSIHCDDIKGLCAGSWTLCPRLAQFMAN